jgi:hypothetical protein
MINQRTTANSHLASWSLVELSFRIKFSLSRKLSGCSHLKWHNVGSKLNKKNEKINKNFIQKIEKRTHFKIRFKTKYKVNFLEKKR